jgi:hypothetical protein
MKEFLRTTNDQTEIIHRLKTKIRSSKKICLWQIDDSGEKIHQNNLEFEYIYEEEGVFTLKTSNSFLRRLESDKEVFILLDDQQYTFKTKISINQKLSATFDIPTEVQIEELRAYPRKSYKLSDKMYVEVVFAGKDRKRTFSLTCPLISISQGGACIVLNRETIKAIDIQAGLLIKYTSDFNKAAIRNARILLKKTMNHDEYFALGIEFSTPLEKSPV